MPGDTELGFGRSGGDVGVAAGLHMRVDAEGDGRALAHLLRDAGEAMEFRHRFDVELEDAMLQAKPDLGFRFADPGEDDAVCGHARRHPSQGRKVAICWTSWHCGGCH